jgi:P4 family phage/plasmid primase-like protien
VRGDTNSILDAARRYHGRGYAPIPLPAGEKKPAIRGWNALRLSEDDLPVHFDGTCNIGLLLGEPSGGLVDVDLDCDEAVDLAGQYLPATPAISGRPSRPGSHRWYICQGAATVQHRDPRTGTMIAELRSTGAQTVVGPSLHPDGERYNPLEGEPAAVPAAMLTACVNALADAVVERRHGRSQTLPETRTPPRVQPLPADLVERRAAAYLDAMPPAISGRGGHGRTYAAATALVHGFGLAPETALQLLLDRYNPRCGPPWTEKELRHKVEDAASKPHDRPRGWLIDAESGPNADISGIAAPGPDSAHDAAPDASLMTDVGNAARLVRRCRDRIRYCYGPSRWLIWDGGRWRPDERGLIVRLCKETALAILDEAKRGPDDRRQDLVKWAMASQKRDRLTAMAALAQPEVAVGPDELDVDPWAFNVLNGTIDLRTGELRPHRREDLITKIAPVEFDPRAEAPRFGRFLDEIFAGDRDLIRFVQRWHGHCLSADIREQYLPIYHGEGNNGKSVLLDTISAVMGDYAGEAPPDLVTVRRHPEHPTEVADLLGKRLVVASETEHEAELRLQLIKRLTGNARLKARLMRQDYFEFARTHKMILVTNNRPSIRENTEAVWRRLRLVPFKVVIPEDERDPDLMRTLWGERAGILAWLVRGCVEWLGDGLTEPDAVMRATEAYRGRANSLDAFLLDRCVLGEGLACATSDLMEAYGDWCGENNRVPLRGRAFAAALKERDCAPAKLGGQRHWVGITLGDGPSGHIGQIGHELPVERRSPPHESVNGNLPSNPSNVSTGDPASRGEKAVSGDMADG